MMPLCTTVGGWECGLQPPREYLLRHQPHSRRTCQLQQIRVYANKHIDTILGIASGEIIPQQKLEIINQEPTEEELRKLMTMAAAIRDNNHAFMTFSPKVFLPLTRICRDSCGYCTFAQPPTPGRRSFMTLEEVVEVARLGAAQGCTEALFTLGDKPEMRYPEVKEELHSMGYHTTLSYVAEAAGAVMRETGLLPHINAGVMSRADVAALRSVSASQGLMLESSSYRLMAPGLPHHDCPDKEPAARLATIDAAGQEGVPFTSGILIGIGETRAERLEALLLLRSLHLSYSHLQEVIIQNFRAKEGTGMARWPEPSLPDLLWTAAVARLVLPPSVSIQAPPNLTPGDAAAELGWRALLQAGINDWGGISPLTRDFVNPEAAWPHLHALAAATAAAGKALVPRLAVYPEYAKSASRWLDRKDGSKSVAAAVLRTMDSEGLARASHWSPGLVESSLGHQSGVSRRSSRPEESEASSRAEPDASTSAVHEVHAGRLRSAPMWVAPRASWAVDLGPDGLLSDVAKPSAHQEVLTLLHRVVEDGHVLTEPEMTGLFAARGSDFEAVCRAADEVRRRVVGDEVTYVVNRNINYTNICTFKCAFCAFSKGKQAEQLRGPAYLIPLEEVTRRTAEASSRGATEVCMQGGIHPDFTGEDYLRLLAAAKAGARDIHVHAFSPLEVWQGAATLGLPLRDFLLELKLAGLGSLPGTAAEVLDDTVRSVICPDKLSTSQWLQVVETAHEVGLRTTSTIMFGHCEEAPSWALHLALLRDLQSRTGGITEFVPLPFVHMEAPLYLKGGARRGPTLRECFLMHAVARLALRGHIDNIQASWVKMGPSRAAQLLRAGCNDMGGSIMNESITRAAGASHGQELAPEEMELLIRQEGRIPRQRTTLYQAAPHNQVSRSFGAQALQPLRATSQDDG
eukprot:jgi/Botrbrau1/20634/Bobra.113_1s0059.2